MRGQRLQWLPDLGLGYLAPTAPFAYDQSYFDNYLALESTPIAAALNAARVAMLREHSGPAETVVDVGVGAGTFMRQAGDRVSGYDVNPVAVRMLRGMQRYLDPRTAAVDVACFWDALEHIDDPSAILANVRRTVLVSLPIFRSPGHALRSKHYKPGEHIWYFTDRGIRWFMAHHGFDCIASNDEETRIGREDIVSFAFRRPCASC